MKYKIFKMSTLIIAPILFVSLPFLTLPLDLAILLTFAWQLPASLGLVALIGLLFESFEIDQKMGG